MVTIDELIRSKRKTISIQITKEGKVVVHAPIKTSNKYIDKILLQKESWIKEKQLEARHKNEIFPPRKCVEGENFLFLGELYSLHFDINSKNVHIKQNALVVPEKYKETAETAITGWYKKEAKLFLIKRTNEIAAKENINFSKVKITSALTRWGSCSSRGTICFTWRLIMAPSNMIDYVIVHELCHILHLDHSAEFWACVEKILPDYSCRRNYFSNNSYFLRKDLFAEN